MAKSRPTIMKRQRELARAEKRRDKAARRAVNTRDNGVDRPEGEDDDYDPDIAHIVAGPQPIAWADEYPAEEEEEEEGDGVDGAVSSDNSEGSSDDSEGTSD
jgi:hypothetical protein